MAFSFFLCYFILIFFPFHFCLFPSLCTPSLFDFSDCCIFLFSIVCFSLFLTSFHFIYLTCFQLNDDNQRNRRIRSKKKNKKKYHCLIKRQTCLFIQLLFFCAFHTFIFPHYVFFCLILTSFFLFTIQRRRKHEKKKIKYAFNFSNCEIVCLCQCNIFVHLSPPKKHLLCRQYIWIDNQIKEEEETCQILLFSTFCKEIEISSSEIEIFYYAYLFESSILLLFFFFFHFFLASIPKLTMNWHNWRSQYDRENANEK